MIYLVSSFHRSGSSMMIKCLQAGGLKAIYNQKLDTQLRSFSVKGYDPNPLGFFQHNIKITDTFYKSYNNCLMKIAFQDIPKLPMGEYTIIFMERDSKSIKKSMRKMLPKSIWPEETAIVVKEEILKSLGRSDINIIRVKYEDIIHNPVEKFELIASNGVPIDVHIAASNVINEFNRN